MKTRAVLCFCAAFSTAPVHAACTFSNVPPEFAYGGGQCFTAPGAVIYAPFRGGYSMPEPPFDIFFLDFDIPYRQRSDSPWAGGIFSGSIYVEDFEDGLVNTQGLEMMLGVMGTGFGVDEDDGIFGNNNSQGKIYYTGFNTGGKARATFSPDMLGNYPRYAGWVIDTNNAADAWFEAYDPSGTLLAKYVFNQEWDDFQFVGVYAPQGIGSIVTDFNERLFIDHVQYGYDIPEPGSAAILLTAVGVGVLSGEGVAAIRMASADVASGVAPAVGRDGTFAAASKRRAGRV